MPNFIPCGGLALPDSPLLKSPVSKWLLLETAKRKSKATMCRPGWVSVKVSPGCISIRSVSREVGRNLKVILQA